MGRTTFILLEQRRKELEADGQARAEQEQSNEPEERAQGQEGEGQQETPLDQMSVKDLKEEAKARGISGASRMNGKELLRALQGEA